VVRAEFIWHHHSGCTPGLSYSLKEKSPKAKDQENGEATRLILLFQSIDWESHIETITDTVREMKNKIAVFELRNSTIFQHV
jgi:hypothetical protein